MFLLLPFDSLIVSLLGISLTVLFTLLLVFIIVPAIFGVSFGIRKLYMKTLLKIFAVITCLLDFRLNLASNRSIIPRLAASLAACAQLSALGKWHLCCQVCLTS